MPPHHLSAGPVPRFAIPSLRAPFPEASVPRWRHWVVGLDDLGRITLPVDVRPAPGAAATLRAVRRTTSLLLRPVDYGAAVSVDRRGRLVLPMWLRRLTDVCGSVLVAATRPDVTCVVVTPTTSLDPLADAALRDDR